MAVDVASWVRATSAALFVVLALAVLVIGRRRVGDLALAGVLVGFGASNVAVNVPTLDPGLRALLFGVFSFLFCFCAVPVALLLPLPATGRARLAVVGGAVLGIAATLGKLGADASIISGIGSAVPSFAFAFELLDFLFPAAIAFTAAAPSLRVAFDPPATREGWWRYAALTGVFGVWAIARWPSTFGDPTRAWVLLSTTILVLSISIPWLVAAARTGSRFALGIGVAAPALGVLAQLYVAAPGASTAAYHDPWGVLGVARLVGWTLLVYAILRADLLGVPLPRVAVRRGPLAAAALAVLFVVAQVAQNFFAAQYGLLMGGVVAGAFLFAAQPLQRAFEGRGARPVAVATPAAASPSRLAASERAYKVALRRFLADGRVTPEEELALAHLADEAGITVRRATEIRHEIEREKGVP